MNWYQNENLTAAFDLYTRRQNQQLPDEAALDAVTLSPTLQGNIARLLTRRKRGLYMLFGTAGRRVASILIAALIALTSVTVSVEAVREKAKQFIAKVFDTHTEISFPNDTSDKPERAPFRKYAPTYIPPGYAVNRASETHLAHNISYSNAEGDTIRFSQVLKSGATIKIDTEGTTYTEITVNGREGITYTNKGTAIVLLWDDHYTYFFSSAYVDAEELIKIAKSLK